MISLTFRCAVVEGGFRGISALVFNGNHFVETPLGARLDPSLGPPMNREMNRNMKKEFMDLWSFDFGPKITWAILNSI